MDSPKMRQNNPTIISGEKYLFLLEEDVWCFMITS
jgi:hypothetical protein